MRTIEQALAPYRATTGIQPALRCIPDWETLDWASVMAFGEITNGGSLPEGFMDEVVDHLDWNRADALSDFEIGD